MTLNSHWSCTELAEQIVSRLLARYGPAIVVIHGGECGVDHAVATACEDLDVPVEARLVSVNQTSFTHDRHEEPRADQSRAGSLRCGSPVDQYQQENAG
jgi:hypothetical protein